MQTVTVHEAKTHMSRLLARVEAGEEIVIARGKTEIAKIVPLHPPVSVRRTPNRFAHLVPPGKDVLDDGFWDPLSVEHLGIGIDGEDLKT
jgi:prevent-host-death family protein